MPITRNLNESSDDNYDPSGQSVSNLNSNALERVEEGSSMEVRPDNVTTLERNALSPEIGETIFNTDTEKNEYWNGYSWVSGSGSGGGGSDTASEIKTKYESNSNTNAFTDAEKSKLANQSGTNTGDQDLSGLQDTLVSGTNIKTINNTSLLGSGNIEISGGGGGASSDLDNRIIVTQANKDTTLGGVIDSTKEYFIDGVVDMGSTQITVPVGGINVRGYSFDLSALLSTNDNYTLFASETPAIGSGIVILNDMTISINGSGSQVYALTDADGTSGVSFTNIYYVGCTSLGELAGFRQGVETNTLRVGGSPSLTFSGLWTGGYRATSTIARDLAGTMTEPLFKDGTAFQMDSRFLTDINCDLPALAPFCDFPTAAFPNPSTLQLKDAIISRDGVFNADDANIFTNLSAADLPCDWDNNIGIPNTFVGGSLNNTSEVQTGILVQNQAVDLSGNFTATDLQHFDNPSGSKLRHKGINPREFTVNFDFVIAGQQGDELEISLVKINKVFSTVIQYTQRRVINNLQGGRDVAYFNGQASVILDQNEFVAWQVTNTSSSQNCTLEVDSTWTVKER